MPIHIRLAQASGIEEMFRVRTSVKENVLTVPEMAGMGITPVSVIERIHDAPCAWVACEGAQIVGFSMIDPVEVSLFATFVLPSYEGIEIGKKLVQSA